MRVRVKQRTNMQHARQQAQGGINHMTLAYVYAQHMPGDKLMACLCVL